MIQNHSMQNELESNQMQHESKMKKLGQKHMDVQDLQTPETPYINFSRISGENGRN